MTEDVPKLSARWIRTACPPMLGRRILENGLILNAAGFGVSAFTGGYPVLISFFDNARRQTCNCERRQSRDRADRETF